MRQGLTEEVAGCVNVPMLEQDRTRAVLQRNEGSLPRETRGVVRGQLRSDRQGRAVGRHGLVKLPAVRIHPGDLFLCDRQIVLRDHVPRVGFRHPLEGRNDVLEKRERRESILDTVCIDLSGFRVRDRFCPLDARMIRICLPRFFILIFRLAWYTPGCLPRIGPP